MWIQQWLLAIFGKLLPIGWQGLASFVGLVVIVVALIPIFKERRHKIKTTSIIRSQLFRDIRHLKRSLTMKKGQLEKIETNAQHFGSEDIKSFKNLEKLYPQTIYLTKKERYTLNNVILHYRIMEFETSTIMLNNVDDILIPVSNLWMLLAVKEFRIDVLSPRILKKYKRMLDRKKQKIFTHFVSKDDLKNLVDYLASQTKGNDGLKNSTKKI